MRSALNILFVLVFIAFSAAFCIHSRAQAYAARCNIPFAFEIGNQHMDAGEYVVTRNRVGVVLLRSGTSSSFQLPIPDDDSGRPTTDKLVFTRVGGESYLTAMRLSESGISLKWPVSHAWQQQMVMQQSAPSTTTVALVRTPR